MVAVVVVGGIGGVVGMVIGVVMVVVVGMVIGGIGVVVGMVVGGIGGVVGMVIGVVMLGAIDSNGISIRGRSSCMLIVLVVVKVYTRDNLLCETIGCSGSTRSIGACVLERRFGSHRVGGVVLVLSLDAPI